MSTNTNLNDVSDHLFSRLASAFLTSYRLYCIVLKHLHDYLFSQVINTDFDKSEEIIERAANGWFSTISIPILNLSILCIFYYKL